jgi:hypothetical protein
MLGVTPGGNAAGTIGVPEYARRRRLDASSRELDEFGAAVIFQPDRVQIGLGADG